MLSSFQATRPLSDEDIARTLLKICASNVLLSLVVWLVGAAPVLVYGWSVGEPVNLRGEMHWSAPLFSFFITWAMMSNVMTAATTGRLKAIARLLVFALLVCTVVEIALRSSGMLRLIEAVEWAALLALTAGIIGLTTWSYHRAYHRGHIRGSHIVIAAIVSAIVLANGLMCFQKISLVAALCVTCVALLSVLPWATSPLAIHWNRHR